MPLPLVHSDPTRRRATRFLGPGSWLRGAVAAALCCSVASCSFIGMQRLPSDHQAGEVPECTSAWTNPLIDMGATVITGSAAVLLLGVASGEEDGGDSFRIAGWSSAGLAAVFIGSGAYGAYQRNRCRAAEVKANSTEPTPTETMLEEGRPLRGTEGAACKEDSDCGEDLLCDEPMKTCIRSSDPPAPTPAPAPETPGDDR